MPMNKSFGITIRPTPGIEKNSELAAGDSRRKFKGRVVFQGNNVRDQHWEWAMFQELSSAPATMEATKTCDLYGSLPGHIVQQADATQAYTQAKLKGVKTWLRMLYDDWPDEWKQAKMKDPVCPLILALYGHPDSGGHWEAHCERIVGAVGFVPVSRENWRSVFWHNELKLMLVIYVDDFKLSGCAKNLKRGLELIRKYLEVEEEQPANLFLGCTHERSVVKVGNSSVNVVTYNMEDYLASTVDAYCKMVKNLTNEDVKLIQVPTPFLPEDQKWSEAGRPMEEDCPTCGCPGSRSNKPKTQSDRLLAERSKQAAVTPDDHPEHTDDTMENAAPGPPRRVAPTMAPPTDVKPEDGTNESETGKTKPKKKKDPNQTPIDPGRLQSIAASIDIDEDLVRGTSLPIRSFACHMSTRTICYEMDRGM